MKNPYKNFIKRWVIALLITISLGALILFYLSFLFEHNLYTTIIQRQIKNHSIYGTALNANSFSYHLEKIKILKPEILAIGTSRAGQFKQKYFKQSFLAAPNAGNTLAESQIFIAEVLKVYQPKMIFLCLEPWWFNEQYLNYGNTSYQKLNGLNITTEKIKNIIKFALEGKLPFALHFFTDTKISNPLTHYDSLGLRAILNSDGSFLDGSYFYASTIYGKTKSLDFHFQDTLWRIQNKHSYFLEGKDISQKRLKNLDSLRKMLKSNGIQLVVIIPPLAPTIYQTMMQKYPNHYEYISKFEQYAKEQHFFNFFNPLILSSDDCEFYDGFHGGDVFYARILKFISKRDQSIKKVLNIHIINETIQNKSGLAYSGEHPSNLKEIDFLGLGCQKTPKSYNLR